MAGGHTFSGILPFQFELLRKFFGICENTLRNLISPSNSRDPTSSNNTSSNNPDGGNQNSSSSSNPSSSRNRGNRNPSKSSSRSSDRSRNPGNSSNPINSGNPNSSSLSSKLKRKADEQPANSSTRNKRARQATPSKRYFRMATHPKRKADETFVPESTGNSKRQRFGDDHTSVSTCSNDNDCDDASDKLATFEKKERDKSCKKPSQKSMKRVHLGDQLDEASSSKTASKNAMTYTDVNESSKVSRALTRAAAEYVEQRNRQNASGANNEANGTELDQNEKANSTSTLGLKTPKAKRVQTNTANTASERNGEVTAMRDEKKAGNSSDLSKAFDKDECKDEHTPTNARNEKFAAQTSRDIALEHSIDANGILMRLFDAAQDFIVQTAAKREKISKARNKMSGAARKKKRNAQYWKNLRVQRLKLLFKQGSKLRETPLAATEIIRMWHDRRSRYMWKNGSCSIQDAAAEGFELAHRVEVRVTM